MSAVRAEEEVKSAIVVRLGRVSYNHDHRSKALSLYKHPVICSSHTVRATSKHQGPALTNRNRNRLRNVLILGRTGEHLLRFAPRGITAVYVTERAQRHAALSLRIGLLPGTWSATAGAGTAKAILLIADVASLRSVVARGIEYGSHEGLEAGCTCGDDRCADFDCGPVVTRTVSTQARDHFRECRTYQMVSSALSKRKSPLMP